MHQKQERSDRTKFIIDAFAMHYTPTQILRLLEQMREEFPEDIPAKSTIASYKVRFADDIKKRRYEMADSELPILDPTWRLLRYQEIVEESVDGVEVESKSGNTYLKKDFKSAISALTQVDKITGYGKDDDEKESMRKMMKSIVEELRVDLLRIPGADPAEVEAIVAQKERELISELEM